MICYRDMSYCSDQDRCATPYVPAAKWKEKK